MKVSEILYALLKLENEAPSDCTKVKFGEINTSILS